MSKNLERKLLAEAFDAIVNDNDIAKATRLFKRHWDLAAKAQYSLLEAEDPDFEVTVMGDDFNDEVMADAGSDREEQLDQAMLVVDELEDKFTGEMNDEVQSKFDELRNIIDEIKLGESDESESSMEDFSVVVEDLKADFEMVNALDDSVNELFDELESKVQGNDESVDEFDDESDDDSDFEELDDSELDESTDFDEKDMPDLEFENKEEDEENNDLSDDSSLSDVEDIESDDNKFEDSEDSDEELLDIKDDLEELLSKLDDIVDDSDEKNSIEEGWEKIADPRKKMTSEEEGVNKKGTMNFGKLRGMTLDKKAGLGTCQTDSKGISADKKVKVQSVENKGTKQWHKVEKPANKAASSQSMLRK